jgi:DNA-binding transcriptional MerR regulator
MDKRHSATIRRHQGHLNASEMALKLGVNRFTYHYWMVRGLVPKPTITFTGRRRYYAEKDIAVIRRIVEGSDDRK